MSTNCLILNDNLTYNLVDNTSEVFNNILAHVAWTCVWLDLR